jgi:hypothetical protein
MCAAQFDAEQLRRGTRHELEHTDDECIAQEIAMDHLVEDPEYYQKLEAMEEGSCDFAVGARRVGGFEMADVEADTVAFDEEYEGPPTLAVPYTANANRERLYGEWSNLINMSPGEIERFLQSPQGQQAGLSREEARRSGVRSGRDSARALLRMKSKPTSRWNDTDWDWASRQVSFVARMRGMPGPLRDEGGRPTRKLLALKLWGHDPEKSQRSRVSGFAANQAPDYYVWKAHAGEDPTTGSVLGAFDRRTAERSAQEASRSGYATAVSFGSDPTERSFRVLSAYSAQQMASNRLGAGRYWVWTVTRRGDRPMLGEGPYGPHDLQGAKTFARIAATEGMHDRAVTLGSDPESEGFSFVRLYERGSGKRLL